MQHVSTGIPFPFERVEPVGLEACRSVDTCCDSVRVGEPRRHASFGRHPLGRAFLLLAVLALPGTGSAVADAQAIIDAQASGGVQQQSAGPSILYVDPVNGNNANEGTDPDFPKKTISIGTGNAYSSIDDGGTIYVRAVTFDATNQSSGWFLRLDASKSVTIEPYDGEYATFHVAGPTYQIQIATSGVIRIRNIVFAPTTTASQGVVHLNSSTNDVQLTMENCTIPSGSGILLQSYHESANSNELTFQNCSLSSSHDYPIWVRSAKSFRIIGGRYDVSGSGSTYSAFHLMRVKTFLSQDVAYTVTRPCIYPSYLSHYVVESFVVDNCTFNVVDPEVNNMDVISLGDIQIPGSVRITNNRCTVSSYATNGVKFIRIGRSDTKNGSVSNLIVANNTFDGGSFDESIPCKHYGIILGRSVDGAVVTHNNLYTCDVGVLSSCARSIIGWNNVVCINPLVHAAGIYNTIEHNTLVSIKGTVRERVEGRVYVFNRLNVWPSDSIEDNTTFGTGYTIARTGSWDALTGVQRDEYKQVVVVSPPGTDPSNIRAYSHWGRVVSTEASRINVDGWYEYGSSTRTSTPPDLSTIRVVTWGYGNIVRNNIMDGSRSLSVINYDFIPVGDIGSQQVDYNLYFREGSPSCLSNIDNQNATGYGWPFILLVLQKVWPHWDSTSPANDSHSVEGDPEFVMVDVANPASSILQANSVLAAVGSASDGTAMGAWQPNIQPDGDGGDFDHDGDVDLVDFSAFQYSFNGPNRTPRGPYGNVFDFDGDSDVDQADFGVFAACFNGVNRTPACQSGE